jgi:hypothetical protein
MTDPLQDWIPFYLKRGEVHWGYMGRERFVEPFFQATLQKLASRPFNQLLRQRTGLDVLPERAASHPGLPLRGLVFHLSRCGSTLAAQTLAALGDTVVLSEPPPVDTLLEWLAAAPSLDSDRSSALLRGLLSALGQPRRPEDRRLFVKTDGWHVRHIDRILAAFPGVPWVFLYRAPVEVLVSHARRPGLFAVPGALIAHGLHPPEALLTRPLEHGAWVQGQILREAAEAMQRHPGGLLVNYRELPETLETRVARHFGLEPNAGDLAAMRSVRACDAKNPLQSFRPDADGKWAEAGDDIRALAARWMEEPYAVLESLRAQEHSSVPGKPPETPPFLR